MNFLLIQKKIEFYMEKEIPTKLKDFRNFLYLVWKHLALPRPTPIQYDIANYLQSKDKRLIINAFRGVGKSWITSAYVCHQLLLNPQLNILVAVSYTHLTLPTICSV